MAPESKGLGGLVDPARLALQFEKHTNRRFIQGYVSWIALPLEFGAEFFITEAFTVAETVEHRQTLIEIGNRKLSFLSSLVTCRERGTF